LFVIQTRVKDISEHSKYRHFRILTHQRSFTEQPKAAAVDGLRFLE